MEIKKGIEETIKSIGFNDTQVIHVLNIISMCESSLKKKIEALENHNLKNKEHIMVLNHHIDYLNQHIIELRRKF